MLISEIGIRNFKSYGNKEEVLKLRTDSGELILIAGSNGAGKCVEKSTIIDIEINDLIINDDLVNFFDTTEMGSKIILYIEKNNNLLYEKYIRFLKKRENNQEQKAII